jgi:hypothetical protein
MARPTLDYERTERTARSSPTARQRLWIILRTHCIASYGGFATSLVLLSLKGEQPAPVMFIFAVVAPVTTAILLPILCVTDAVLMELTAKPLAVPLVTFGLPYVTFAVLTIWLRAERRVRNHTRA